MSRGTRVLDRICGPLGRLRIASGTHKKAEWVKLNGMVTDLMRDRRWDLLKLLQARALDPRDLYWKLFRQQSIPSAEDLRPLEATALGWVARYQRAESTQYRYDGLWRRFAVRHPNVSLGQLPECLKEDRDVLPAPSWNLLRSAALSMLADVVGRRSALYLAVVDLPHVEETDRRKGNPQTLEQVKALALAMPEDAGILWGLCLTGMRRGEFWGAWDVLPDRLCVHGTKTKAAERAIPKVFPVARPKGDYFRFAHRLHRVTGGRVRPHDLRKTYAGWLEDAGVPRTRRRIYLGHAVGDITELYERREVTQYLCEDAERMRVWLGEGPAQRLHVLSA